MPNMKILFASSSYKIYQKMAIDYTSNISNPLRPEAPLTLLTPSFPHPKHPSGTNWGAPAAAAKMAGARARKKGVGPLFHPRTRAAVAMAIPFEGAAALSRCCHDGGTLSSFRGKNGGGRSSWGEWRKGSLFARVFWGIWDFLSGFCLKRPRALRWYFRACSLRM